ncbi:regulatory protein, ArsR [Methanoregula boonei 6A8]|jgi:ArsR family transcriptional regulator|uniref:Regulatory protein, ArsR n=1 Tax=Methanoregula boonei (strain DSM 21154 / JCM 14090 / 6A8) TaxID=456442 RepID=A7I917_METB6|nr:ArsR family transcriptional regulator [Methanoregula boonei]ABS56228.1 regulatory protein, ArsR [Methanoregula boonei 6A8]
MEDLAEVARLLDILGNRNRRRIIGLLRQKPCFVTEISETLMISPKAVIEHLQLMEREEILSCQTDDRRRKYYYLANDILVDVSLRSLQSAMIGLDVEGKNMENERTRQAVVMLAKMVQAHDQLVTHLEQLNHDIDTKLADLARNHNDLFKSERELSVAIALSHEPLTPEELREATGYTQEELEPVVAEFVQRGIAGRTKNRIHLRGVHADQSQ